LRREHTSPPPDQIKMVRTTGHTALPLIDKRGPNSSLITCAKITEKVAKEENGSAGHLQLECGNSFSIVDAQDCRLLNLKLPEKAQRQKPRRALTVVALGMTVVDAVTKYLRIVKRKKTILDIVEALEKGGFTHQFAPRLKAVPSIKSSSTASRLSRAGR
jgi:hypothetical protein